MVSVFDEYTIPVEELAPRTYRLGSAGVLADSFPGLPGDGFTVTCDRQRALVREDIQFLTWDHPLVTGAIDLLLGSEKGNSCFVEIPTVDQEGLSLEAIYVLECIAPPHLHVDRFLPPTPMTIVVDRAGRFAVPLFAQPEFRELLPRLIDDAHDIAISRSAEITSQAQQGMRSQMDLEISRLRELQKVNRSVRDEEIQLLVVQNQELDGHLQQARVRLDAIRLSHLLKK
jgi:ATP-dependent helicase HepA